MTKAVISARLDKSERPFKPYLSIQVDGLDSKEFETIENWLRQADSYSYDRVPPEQNESGMLSADFENMGRATQFIDFLAGEVGVQYNIDSILAKKIMKIAMYEAHR